MIAEAEGEDGQGRPIRARWTLWAEAGAGPDTPAAPAAAMVRHLLAGGQMQSGAYACAGLLPLDAILAELAGLPIATRRNESHPGDVSLFQRLLGRRFDLLPPCLRAVHDGRQCASFAGTVVVRTGKGYIARIIQRVLGLPPTGRMKAAVEIAIEGSGERWTRRFGSARFVSKLSACPSHSSFEERFAPLHFAFTLTASPRGVIWLAGGWRLWRLPLPARLAPRIRAAACAVNGRYQFRVAVAHRWTGLLFAYRGTLL